MSASADQIQNYRFCKTVLSFQPVNYMFSDLKIRGEMEVIITADADDMLFRSLITFLNSIKYIGMLKSPTIHNKIAIS